MVEIVNFTPYANMRFSNLDASGMEFGVFMAKVAFDIPFEGGMCRLSDEQEPFMLTDEYWGGLTESSLRYASDLVPYKPTSDVTFDATAYAPNGEPARSWIIETAVEDAQGNRRSKRLRVTGPRFWVPQWKRALTDEEATEWRRYRHLFAGWELSEPEPITSLDVRYEYAFGGWISMGTDDEGSPIVSAYERNPVGRGWIDWEWTDHTRPVPAPQIEDPDDPIVEPYAQYAPQGLGPMPAAWLPRREYGGTYDQHWIDHVWPRWAEDYNFRFHNCAHPDLQTERYLTFPVRFTLRNMHPSYTVWSFTLPDRMLSLLVVGQDHPLTAPAFSLDLVHLEIGSATIDDPRAYCVHRTPFDLSDAEQITLVERERNGLVVEFETLTPEAVACDPELLDHRASVSLKNGGA